MNLIRDVFPQNLKLLMRNTKNVSQFGRDVGIDRSKINRFLNGVSSPRPEELLKICEYFGVSADVVLYPLTYIENVSEKGKGTGLKLKEIVDSRDFSISPQRLPSGLYQQWRHSSSKPGMIYCTIFKIYRVGETVLSKQYETWDVYAYSQQYAQKKSREMIGVLIGHATGFSEICFSKNMPAVYFAYFSYGYMTNEFLFPGDYVATPNALTSAATGKELWRYLGTNHGRILAAARQTGYSDYVDTEFYVQEILGEPR